MSNITEFWNVNHAVGIELDASKGNTNTHIDISSIIIRDTFPKEIPDNFVALEPAVGTGSFYFPMVDLLIAKGFGIQKIITEMIYAFDIDSDAISFLKQKLHKDYGVQSFTNAKIFNEDFLFSELDIQVDYIGTNPPYISSTNINFSPFSSRAEMYEAARVKLNCEFSNKSDIYIMFKIKCMNMMKPGGVKVFLCSDGWLDSEYGSVIRDRYVSGDFHLQRVFSSNLFPFFRDDTSAIITIVKKTKNVGSTFVGVNTKRISEIETLVGVEDYEMPFENLKMLFSGQYTCGVRNFFVVHGGKFIENTEMFHEIIPNTTFLKSIVEISNSSVSVADLQRNGEIDDTANIGECIPIFWQKIVIYQINKLTDL